MRFYFHINSEQGHVDDEEGIELPSFLDALREADQIAQELREDPETADLRDGVVQIVCVSGQFFLAVPISPGRTIERFLN